MMKRSAFLLTFFLLRGGDSALGQSGSQGAGGRPPGDTAEAVERARGQYRMLLKPDFIRLRVVPSHYEQDDIPEEPAWRYEEGSGINFRLLITNTLVEPVSLSFTGAYDQTRLQLHKGDALVPYRKATAEILRAADKGPVALRAVPGTLEHNEPWAVLIQLGDWYGPLGQGEYRLVVRMRFVHEGEWVDAAPVTFKVVPR